MIGLATRASDPTPAFAATDADVPHRPPAVSGRTKMLDLRYNEMWNDWAGDELLLPAAAEPARCAHGQLVLSWKNLTVEVRHTVGSLFGPSKTTRKEILTDVSGSVQSGTLLGIMGPSGSGKTTMMATISHRTKGNFNGELLLNGKPVSEEIMIKMSGFVPQHDISFDQLTAYEHLFLMARLKTDRRRRSSTGAVTGPGMRVDHVVRTLGMGRFLGTRIAQLSGGERKKVALAVQLLDDPPMLFCDEITTGLDSYTAAHIVNTLRAVARTGKIVVCTIHQPASGVFGKFDDVALLADGRLAYHGPVSMVNQFFQKFSYSCPNMFNEAEFVISILNSENESVKTNVNKMCQLTSSKEQMAFNYSLLSIKKQLNYQEHEDKKPTWITYFSLLFDRSIKCFQRSYKGKLLELATVLFLGVVISLPYSNIQFDTNAVQNWEGFWLIFVINFVFHFSFSAISIYQVTFSVVHREVHNKVYPLSAYYMSELIISIIWLTMKMLVYCVFAFWFVGAEWNSMKLLVFFMVSLASFSYGSLLASFFNCIENSVMFATVYNSLALCLSGAYLSFMSLPKVIYSLRYLSLFFLSCEIVSIEFWSRIKYLECVDVTNCLGNGKAVLNKYGYIDSEFYSDLLILVVFCTAAQVYSYFGVLKKMKKQPAY